MKEGLPWYLKANFGNYQEAQEKEDGILSHKCILASIINWKNVNIPAFDIVTEL